MTEGTSTQRSGARDAARLAACVALALLAWSASIVRGGFAYDDREAVLENPVVEGSAPWSAAFERDYWDHLGPAGHYRPLASLSLRLDHRLHGPERSRGWHLTNVLLHALVVLLAGLAWIRLSGGARAPWPWLGLCLFAAHPVLADSVAWISGRSSMLSALAGVGACALLARLSREGATPVAARTVAVACTAGLGLLGALCGKEDGLVFALVLPLVAGRTSRRLALSAAAGVALALVAYGALRARALGSPWPRAPAAPLAHVALPERLLVAGRAQLEGLRLLVWPFHHPPTYERSAALAVPGPDASHAQRLLGAAGWLPWLFALAHGLRALLRGRPSPASLAALLVALALVPVLQLVPSGVVFAPRFLYLPLLLAAPLTQRLLAGLHRRVGPWAPAALLLLACAGAWVRSEVYSSRRAFHRSVLAHRPDDPVAWNELGLAEEEDGDLEAARIAFKRSAVLDVSYGRPWSNLGRLELAEGRPEQARVWFRRAVERGASNPVAHVNLGAACVRLERWSEAEAAYSRALELAPGMVIAWRGLARALEAQGRADAARSALERALELAPGDEVASERLERLR